MKERIWSVLVFLSCTTAPSTGFSPASETTPWTTRMFWSGFFLLAGAASATLRSANAAATRIPTTRRIWTSDILDARHAAGVSACAQDRRDTGLLPVILFLCVAARGFLFFLLEVFSRLKLERTRADDLQIRAAFVAA